MQHADALLLAALRTAPRRYRMPALPPDATAARAGDPETALAFTIEAVRQGSATPEVRTLFLDALAVLVRKALAPAGGDPAFQAQVLRARSGATAEYLRLASQEAADRRAVRAAVDALAHPGKLRQRPAGAEREALAGLHALAGDEAWAALADADVPQALQAPLARLRRVAELRGAPDVQRYLALSAQRGPLAGTDAANAQGLAAARTGSQAEQATLAAFRAIAALLQERAGTGHYRVVGSLRTPRGFPGAPDKAKDEWDAAIVRDGGDEGAELVLLAEVKASAAAATPDFGRLLRGLERLALAEPQARYAFAHAEGMVQLAGSSLRRLRPAGQALPPHVVYCCAADEVQPAALSAATRAVLLGEPAAVAFALRVLEGEPAQEEELAPVWDALATAPRLRSALHQYRTAVAAREAMLHPHDLLAAVRDRLRPAQNRGAPWP